MNFVLIVNNNTWVGLFNVGNPVCDSLAIETQFCVLKSIKKAHEVSEKTSEHQKSIKIRDRNFVFCGRVLFVSFNIKRLNAEPVYESWMSDHDIVFADLEID